MEWLQWIGDAVGYRERPDEIALGEALLRGLIVYVGALALLRLGEKRSFGRNTAFDLVLAIMFGSTVSRGITGNSPLIPALGAGALLVAAHWVAASLSYRWSAVGTVVKGRTRELVRDGEILEGAMHASHISRQDLLEAMRRSGLDDFDRIRSAHLERDGSISVVTSKRPPTLTDVEVERGVQTVRIVLE